MTTSTDEKCYFLVAIVAILILIGIASTFSIISSKKAEEKRRQEQEANAARLALELFTAEDLQKIAYYSNLVNK